MRKSFSLWRLVFYSFTVFSLLLIFSAYYAPEMMVAMTNQVWALCGW